MTDTEQEDQTVEIDVPDLPKQDSEDNEDPKVEYVHGLPKKPDSQKRYK
jgi:hypothetical protein